MRELLNDPTLAEAIVVLRDERPVVDAIDTAPDNVSVRLLSRAYGHDNAIALFLSLSEPLPSEREELQQTFGAKLDEITMPPEP
jgi:hypothetical protein